MTQQTPALTRSTKIHTPPGASPKAGTPHVVLPRKNRKPCITPRPMAPSLDTVEPADLPLECGYEVAKMMRPAELHLVGLRVEFERLHRENSDLQEENYLLQRRLATPTTTSKEEANLLYKEKANGPPKGDVCALEVNHAEEYPVISDAAEYEHLHQENNHLQKESHLLQGRLATPTTTSNEDTNLSYQGKAKGSSSGIVCIPETNHTVEYPVVSETGDNESSESGDKVNMNYKRSMAGAKTDSVEFGKTIAAAPNASTGSMCENNTMSLLFSGSMGTSKPREHKVAKLHSWFDRLIQLGEDGLSSSRLLGILKQVHGSQANLLSLDEIESVIRTLHRIHADHLETSGTDVEGGYFHPANTSSCADNVLLFPAFADLVLFDRTQEIIEESPTIHEHALIIRDALMRQHIDDLIFHYARIPPPRAVTAKEKRDAYIIGLLDPLVAVVILLNGLTIGISSDIEWHGWDYLEVAFTTFFFLEIALKVSLHGFRTHFFGQDWAWNWFDAVVVFLALLDAPLSLVASSSDTNLSNFSVVRMARLARLTRMLRLVRILRLRIFQELLLMVKGVVAGLRTLFWAIVMLIAIVYACAVALRETVGQDQHVMNDIHHTVLFGTMPWSMFSTFRCFLSDCTLLDGTPVAGHLYELYGYTFALPYALMVMFITFGIFNMVTAVFVENVMESARQRQLMSKEKEQNRVAELLRNLVYRLAGKQRPSQLGGKRNAPSPDAHVRSYPSAPSTWLSWIRAVSKFVSNPSLRLPSSQLLRESWRSTIWELRINSEITRTSFLLAIEDPKVSSLIENLEVNISDPIELFDVLDADGSGCIDVGELISGIMRLRSSETKHLVVAITLGIRGIRDTLRRTSAEVRQIQHLFSGVRTVRADRNKPNSQHRHREKTVGDDGDSYKMSLCSLSPCTSERC